jgi:transglutaminase-like putative cysteine protease
MRLHVRHLTRIAYSESVSEEVVECRLGPLSDANQRWERFELRIRPSGHLRPYEDGFGNAGYLATLVEPHDAIELIAQSDVETMLSNPFVPPPAPPRPITCQETYDYLTASSLIPANRELNRLADGFRPDGVDDAFASAHALSQEVHATLAYTPNATTTTSTVTEVLERRAGVCQDFAHVLIGLCRAVGIPARYVSGYVLSHNPAAVNPGTGEDTPTTSHAWVEAYSPTHGWRGFDPANNILADEHHVKIAVGRDYSDVPPTRGTFRGRAEQVLSVEVTVTSRG